MNGNGFTPQILAAFGFTPDPRVMVTSVSYAQFLPTHCKPRNSKTPPSLPRIYGKIWLALGKETRWVGFGLFYKNGQLSHEAHVILERFNQLTAAQAELIATIPAERKAAPAIEEVKAPAFRVMVSLNETYYAVNYYGYIDRRLTYRFKWEVIDAAGNVHEEGEAEDQNQGYAETWAKEQGELALLDVLANEIEDEDE